MQRDALHDSGRGGAVAGQIEIGDRTVDKGDRAVETDLLRDQPRDVYRLRGERYHLNPQQVRALADMGTFRVLDTEDLVRSVYGGDRAMAWRDLLHLQSQQLATLANPRRGIGATGMSGLVQPWMRTTSQAPAGRLHYVSLTKPGRRLARQLVGKPDQRLYVGGKKLREMRHDAALYRVFERAQGQLTDSGARVLRVVLDDELKRAMNRDLVTAKRLEGPARAERLQRIAARHQLLVVGDQIPLPDLRIEYEAQDGQRSHLDLEYLTENYRSRSIAQKAAAGFQLVAERAVKGTVARVTATSDRAAGGRRPDDDSLAERVLR